MAFGVKVKNLKTKNEYTIETLFEAIKDHEFSAGKASLVKHGFNQVIVFPAIDRQNQCWILAYSTKPGSKFQVSKNEQAGVDNMVSNMALDAVTNGWSSMGKVFGKNSKAAEQQVEAVFAELEAMDL